VSADKPGRNEPCPCGSGRRYKNCHGAVAANGPSSAPVATARPEGDVASLVALARDAIGRRDFATAIAAGERAVRAKPGDADAWIVLGLAREAGDPAAAADAWRRAIAIASKLPEPHFRLGDFHRRRGEHALAVDAYRDALACGLEHPALRNNLALSLDAGGDLDAAEAEYRRAIASDPGFVHAFVNLADLLVRRKRYREACELYDRALAQKPDVAQIWLHRATAHYHLGNLTSARESFARALALDPNSTDALVGEASVCVAHQDFAQASMLLHRALSLAPSHAQAQDMLLYVDQQTCCWDDFHRRIEVQRRRLADADTPPIPPHNLVALPYSPAELLAAARKWMRERIAPRALPRPPLAPYAEGRLRIGYVSTDFRRHPLATLLTEVIERHDRQRFEVFGYSIGPNDDSDEGMRFQRAFDRFAEVRSESTAEIVRRIRNDGIAILFDTNGYVQHARGDIFAERPAALQINAIGFPGTLGADYYDYILSDASMTAPEDAKFFAERFMLLPHCYLPSDSVRGMDPVPTRASCGLPDDAFVFCCFNAPYKILPNVFDVWTRLLQAVPRSVLWLLDSHPVATRNLRDEAARRGIAPERIVFAPRVELRKHLARHVLADLFLDTLPCNAHTTANDALYAGLPLLTCRGDTFASRASASQLRAAGLPELVTTSLAEYEALAQRLAQDGALLESYRSRLTQGRGTLPLFDTAGYVRALEALLLDAWDRLLTAK
jgi:predicted O-linked N-acetylglucosamine transferase (SPINDLY family)